MVGFRIGNTLSESGTVSRGLCGTDANNLLTSVVERTKIQRMDGEMCIRDRDKPYDAELDFIVTLKSSSASYGLSSAARIFKSSVSEAKVVSRGVYCISR